MQVTTAQVKEAVMFPIRTLLDNLSQEEASNPIQLGLRDQATAFLGTITPQIEVNLELAALGDQLALTNLRIISSQAEAALASSAADLAAKFSNRITAAIESALSVGMKILVNAV